jgi:hypothetical protein
MLNEVFKIGNSTYSSTGVGRGGLFNFQIQRETGHAVKLLALSSRVFSKRCQFLRSGT